MKISARLSALIIVSVLFFAGLTVFAPGANAANSADGYVPTRYSLSLSGGRSYYPDGEVAIAIATLAAVFDYDRIWFHPAPDKLRFKVEASAGVAYEPSARFVGSADMLATLYLWQEEGAAFNPYVEAGVGGIYTDFKRPGQGSRLNFNPILGAGLDFDCYFVAVRAHHLSNLYTNRHNKSLDYLVLQAGFYF